MNWLPSVNQDGVRVDGHADVDNQLLPSHSAARPSQKARPPHPLRATRSPGRNRQKVEEDDNCYSSGYTQKTAGRGVSSAAASQAHVMRLMKNWSAGGSVSIE